MTGLKSYWATFTKVLLGLLERPMWMMLLLSLCVMSLVYANRTVWDLPVGVVDMDNSPASRLMARSLDATPKVQVIAYPDLETAITDMKWRKLFAVVILPLDLERKLLAGTPVAIPVFGDATNRLPNGQIQLDVQAAYQQMLAAYNTDLMLKSGFNYRQAEVVLNPILSRTQSLFNPGISFAAIIFPGLLVMLLQHSLMIASVRVSLVLRAQGKPPLSVYLGGLSALLPIWLFLSIVLFILWPWVLGYRQTAGIAEILLLTFPFLLAVLGLGRFLTECLRSVERIYLTLSFITMPVFYISGTIWPLQAQPAWVRAVSSMLPSTWATKAIAGVNQMGLSWQLVMPDVLILLALGAFYTLTGMGVALLHDSARLRRWLRHRK